MDKRLGIVILSVIVVASVINGNKSVRSFKKCLANKCQDTVMNRKCCHLGTKLAKRSYSCSVDAVLSTQKYLRSLKHKIHSKTTLPANRLFHKVRQCKRYEDCLHCCCMHHKRYIFSLSKYRKFNYGG